MIKRPRVGLPVDNEDNLIARCLGWLRARPTHRKSDEWLLFLFSGESI